MLKRQASTSKLTLQSLSHSIRPQASLPRRRKHAYTPFSTTASSSTTSSILTINPQSTLTDRNNNVLFADLGIQQTNPNSQPDPTPEPEGTEEVDDIEWQIRTGRAIFVLQETLPTFFTTGLITSIDKDSGAPRPETPLTMHFPLTSLPPFKDHSDLESIYSPNVRLSYTPPAALPPPLPKMFHIEGISLYLASSAFARHTMNALYSDLKVVPTKMEIIPAKMTSSPSSSSSTEPEDREVGKKKKRLNRDKSILLNLNVTGVARVSGARGEWDVSSTYTFSPLTGLILTHTVNSIHPAPHVAVYEGLRKAFGIGWSDGPGRRSEPGVGVGGMGVGCRGDAGKQG